MTTDKVPFYIPGWEAGIVLKFVFLSLVWSEKKVYAYYIPVFHYLHFVNFEKKILGLKSSSELMLYVPTLNQTF